MSLNLFDPGVIQKKFGKEAFDFFTHNSSAVAVWYDDLPRSEYLHKALVDGIINIAFDYDRVGSSKTGYVYRITGKDFSATFPPKPIKKKKSP